MIIQIVSVAIAFCSVLAVIWFGLRNQRLARENADLQKRLLGIEEARERDRQVAATKARISAGIEKRGNSDRLVIRNSGPVVAENVSALLDRTPLLQHPAIPGGEQEKRRIGPNSEISYLMALNFQTHPPFDLQITWTDASGEPGSYGTTLSQ
jgi:hypothetical protein